jgi:hypothetical protein
MEISEFVLRVAFLALPGLVASKIYRKLRGRGAESKTWEDFTQILLFALLSYVMLAGLLALPSYDQDANVQAASVADPNSDNLGSATTHDHRRFWDRVSVIGAVFDSKKPIDVSEIFLASLIGIFLGVSASFVHKRNLAMRFFQRIGATKRFGDEDVWDFFLGSPDTDKWLFVRDHKIDLVYFGTITQYSESQRDRELVIEDVSVHSAEGKFMYECKAIYVSRARDDLTIELPDFDKLRAKMEQEDELKTKNCSVAEKESDHGQTHN